MELDIVSRLHQVTVACNEQITTAQRVKGDAFASAAGSIFEIQQMVFLVRELINGRSDLTPSQADMYRLVAATLLSALADAVAAPLSAQDREEARRLGEQMGERFENMFIQ